MELLEYPRSYISDNYETLEKGSPLFSNIEKHICIQRLNHFQDTGTDKYFRILWIRSGVESVGIDQEKFIPFPNQIAFISPGKKLKLETSDEPEGWILRFSRTYLNILRHENYAIGSLDIFSASDEIHKIVLSPKIGENIQMLAGMIDELAGSQIPKKENGINALLKAILVYCDSKCNVKLNINGNAQDIGIVSRFKQLVSENYTQLHMVSDYAKMMSITPKYLNQVVKQIMGVTAKQVIQEQLIIQARRDLKFSNQSVKEIAFSLGFTDPFHFSSFFKELVGSPPTRYRDK